MPKSLILAARLTPPTFTPRPTGRPFFALALAGAFALGTHAQAATFTWFNSTGLWNSNASWLENAIPPLADPTTQLIFGGTGALGYTSTDDIPGALQLNVLTLNSTATALNTITASAGSSLNFLSNAAVTPTLVNTGTGRFDISAPITFANNLTVKLGATPINGGLITFSGGLTQGGTSAFRVENTTSATVTAASVLQVALAATNSFGTTTPITVNTGASNAGIGALTVLSLNSPFALGNSAINSSLAPVILSVNNNLVGTNSATGGQVSINGTPTDWSSILQIGSTIGTAPNATGITVNGVSYGTGVGQTPMDFSYQVTTNSAPGAGQLRLANTATNSTGGVGFSALGNGTGTANNRVVGLFAPGSTTALALLRKGFNYASGNTDHLTFGSPSANGTLILLNDVDPGGFANNGVARGFQTVRGIGNVPEASLAGNLATSGNGAQMPAIFFDGNGGMVFSNGNGFGVALSYTLRAGAVYVGANDAASATLNGALGRSVAAFTMGTQNTNANLAFMTYGAGAGVGASPTITTARAVTIPNFTHNSVTLGSFTNDYAAFTGAISLGSTTPTTFIAGNGIGTNGTTPGSGGRVDFSGVISGASPVVIGPATVEGDTTTAGISLTQSGMVVFNNIANSYTGSTTISSGTLSTGPAGTVTDGGFASSIGQSSNAATSLVLNGGTLQYAGAGVAASTDRLFTVTENGGGLDASGVNPITFAGNGVGSANAVAYTGSGARILAFKGTNTGANIFAPSIADGTGGATSVTKSDAGSWVLSGAHTYSGATTINAGTLTLSSSASLSGTAITVAGGGSLLALPTTGNLAIGTTGASLNLNAGSTFSMSDGGIGTVTLNTVGAGAGTVLTLGGTTASPVSLTFDLGNIGADRLIANNGLISFAGTPQNNISLNTLSGAAPATLTGIPLLSVPNGILSLSSFSLQTSAVNFGSSSFLASLSLGSGGHDLLLNLAAASLNHYWKGGTSGSWNTAANFVTGPASATLQAAVPASQNNVFLTANTAANLAQTLNGTFTINSLSFTGTGTSAATGAVTLAAGTGGPLTLNAVNPFSDSASNNYAAGTGIVVQEGSAAHTISANLALGVNQTWEIDNDTNKGLTVSGIISGLNRILTKTGSGRLVLSGANTYSGPTIVNAGILQIGNGTTGSLAVGSAVTVGASGTLALKQPDGATFSNPIGGTGTLTQNGTGTTTLTGPNTFSGTTQIVSGILALGDSLALQNSTLDYNNLGGSLSFGILTQASLGGLSGAQNLDLTNTALAPVALTFGSRDAIYSGVLSNVGSVVKAGAGSSQTLSGLNTYTGATTINAGTLTAGTATVPGVGGAFGMNSAVTLANSPSAALDITGFDTQIGSLTGGGNVVLGAATLTIGGDGTSPAAYFGTISGTGQVQKIGPGTLTLTGANSYTGSTLLNGGTVSITGAQNLGAVPGAFAPNNVVFDGGTLQSTTTLTLTNRGITLLAGGGTFAPINARLTLAASTVISGAGALTVAGSNQLAIQSLNTYSGGTTILPGVQVVVESSSNGPDDNPTEGPFGTGVVNLNGGDMRSATTVSAIVRNPVNVAADTTFFSFAASTDRDLTFTGTTLLAGGTRTLTVNTSPVAGNTGVFFNGSIGDGGNAYGLIKAGLGTLTLQGANTFTGITTVNAGVLGVGVLANGAAPSSLGQSALGAGSLLLANNTTLRYVGADASTDRTFTMNLNAAGQGVTLAASGTGVINFTNLAAPLYGTVDQTRTLTLSGTNTGANTLAAVLTDNGTGALALSKSDLGAWTLTGANTYTGPTTISGGALVLANANALPGGVGTAGGTSALTLNGGVVGLATADFTRGLGPGSAQVQFTGSGGFAAYGANRNVNLGGASAGLVWNGTTNFLSTGSSLLLSSAGADKTVTFQNAIDLNGAARTVSVADGSAAVDAILSGSLTGTGGGGLTKDGPGTLVLAASNSYSGATTVNAGTLLVNGSISGSTTTVNAAGTLGGVGTLGSVNVVDGTFAPGAAGTGTLHTGTLSLSANATSKYELTLSNATPGGGVNDLALVTGNLTIDGFVQIIQLGGALNDGDIYTLFDYTGTLTDNGLQLDSTFLAAHPGAAIVIDTLNTQVLLTVPEPGTLTSLFAGVGLLLGLRRRRHS